MDALAARQPTPGGGAVASLLGAIGAALAAMVVNYSRGKKALLEHDDLHQSALRQLDACRQRALELADIDARAYEQLSELWKLPEDDPRRQREWAASVDAAIAAPQAVLQSSIELLRMLTELHGATNTMLDSDLAIAAVCGEAAARAAAWNVRINLPLMKARAEAASIESETARQVDQAIELARQVEVSCGHG